MNCAIYKICNPLGECLCVGSTTAPRIRSMAHKLRFPNGVFSIIEEVPIRKRSRAEKAAITRFKVVGQAVQNKRIPSETSPQVMRAKLLALTIGKTFQVKTETERVKVLQIAKILQVAIRTRRAKAGFEVTRVLQ